MTEPKKTGWGGVRPGAGRPKSAAGVTLSVYIPRSVAAETKKRATERGESLSKYVTDAIEQRNREKRPDLRVHESAAWFDAYIDAAKTEEELNEIDIRLNYTYTGSESGRKRLRERIQAEKMRIRKEQGGKS